MMPPSRRTSRILVSALSSSIILEVFELFLTVRSGKVVERRWYEKNKHIFPASRWEHYDPSVRRDAVKYTIHGGEIK